MKNEVPLNAGANIPLATELLFLLFVRNLKNINYKGQIGNAVQLNFH